MASGLDGLAVRQVQACKLRGLERVDVAGQLVTIAWAAVAVLVAVGITFTALAALAPLAFRARATCVLRTVLTLALPLAMAA